MVMKSAQGCVCIQIRNSEQFAEMATLFLCQ
jgi:hypothetical protein